MNRYRVVALALSLLVLGGAALAAGSAAGMVRSTSDPYLAREAVAALGKIGTPAALAFLHSSRDHPWAMVRKAVETALACAEGR